MRDLKFEFKINEKNKLNVAKIEFDSFSCDGSIIMIAIKIKKIKHTRFFISEGKPNNGHGYKRKRSVDSEDYDIIEKDKKLIQKNGYNHLEYYFDFEGDDNAKDFIFRFEIPIKYLEIKNNQYKITIDGLFFNIGTEQDETEEGVIIFEPD